MALERTRAAAARIAEREAALRANNIRNDAVAAAPVDTGRLRQSIGLQKRGEGHYRVGTNVEYAPYVEYGTRRMAAQPFMRPALERNRGR